MVEHLVMVCWVVGSILVSGSNNLPLIPVSAKHLVSVCVNVCVSVCVCVCVCESVCICVCACVCV